MLLARKLKDQIARIIAKAEGGFTFEPGFVLAGSNHPQIVRWVKTSGDILETIQKFLEEVELDFDALEIGQEYVMPMAIESFELYEDPRGFMPETSGYQPIEGKAPSEFPTWDDLTQWIDDLYQCWGVKKSDRMTFEQYELDPVLALEDRLSHKQLQTFHQHLSETLENPVFAPLHDKQKLAKAVFEMLNPYPNALEIKLYFKVSEAMDSVSTCIGGEAADRWARNHKGNAYSSDDYSFEQTMALPVGLNPMGHTLADLSQRVIPKKARKVNPIAAKAAKLGAKLEAKLEAEKAAEIARVEAQGLESRAAATYNKAKAAKISAERRLNDIFGDREGLKEQFLVIKEELAAIPDFKLGKLISSQADVKGWFATWEGHRGAIWWTVGNGWEAGTRPNQNELKGPWEGFDLIQQLECNGIDADNWSNARDEKAEAEAIALQQEEKAKQVKKSKQGGRFQLSFGSIPYED